MTENEIGKIIVDCAIKVHKNLGPGLLESCYEVCLMYELMQAGLRVERQKALPVVYEYVKLDAGFRIDLLVENMVVIELKSVERIVDIHQAQVITYLKLGNYKLGYLMNFNVLLMKDGIKRFVNNL